jgi:tripartite-type tricarboxylate transporter receptor subunit TctC
MSYRKTWIACFAMVALASVILPVAAQVPWPNKPITYIVPFPAGGTTDTLARIIGQKLSAALGQNVLVDNKPGRRREYWR